MLGFLNKLFDENRKVLKKTYPIVNQINALEEQMQAKSDEELKAQTQKFKAELKEGKTLDDILPEAFATVREVAKRTTGLRPYDVQLMGGILLHWGKIAEMKTGEGKTLVATLPVYLNALAGKGVHLVTVNDYLARRDAVWVGQIYSELGLTIGVINSDNTSYLYDATFKEEKDAERDEIGDYKIVYEFLKPSSRKQAYNADVTYGTNSEFGFDYLRDNITLDKNDLRQRGFNYAIVDEIDSILIDEARTPLIISAPNQEDKEIYKHFVNIANSLIKDEDYTIDEKTKSVILKTDGVKKVEKRLNINNLYSKENIILVDTLEVSLKAKELYTNGKEYVVTPEKKVVIIDELTGRMQPGRRWSDGLHQAIEAKEGVEIEEESKTYASVTYQNYFRMYKKLSGMTGTAETSKEEFFKVYNLDVVVVPTNKPIARKDLKDAVFGTELGKFQAIAKKIKELNKKGQPVLVGTASVERSEMLSEFLVKEKIKHSVLNAKNHEKEGEIIASAGKIGAVTIATNMAGRGVDIKLGGPEATEEEYQKVLALGGLYVIGTERHESRRIDNQLRGRSGRQGDPGETQFYISLDDHLMRVFGNQDFFKMILEKKKQLQDGEDTPIESRVMSKAVETAQQKIEGFQFDGRKHVLDYDDVLDIQRKAIYKKRKEVLLAEDEEIYNFIESEFADDKEFLQKLQDKKTKLDAEDVDFDDFLKKQYLEIIDKMWIDHLNVMEHLKNAVAMQAYGQKDPLVEYKMEAKKYFDGFFDELKEKYKSTIIYTDLVFLKKMEDMKSEMEIQSELAIKSSGKSEETQKPQTIVKSEKEKVGRNELCPCGSGEKYKKCCGKNK